MTASEVPRLFSCEDGSYSPDALAACGAAPQKPAACVPLARTARQAPQRGWVRPRGRRAVTPSRGSHRGRAAALDKHPGPGFNSGGGGLLALRRGGAAAGPAPPPQRRPGLAPTSPTGNTGKAEVPAGQGSAGIFFPFGQFGFSSKPES